MSVATSIEGFTPEVPGWQRCRVLLRRCLHSTAEIWATSDICASFILNLSRWHAILNLTRWQVLSIIYIYLSSDLSIYLSINLSIDQPIYLFIDISIYLYIYSYSYI